MSIKMLSTICGLAGLLAVLAMAAPSEKPGQADGPRDPFAGTYSGTFQTLGEYGGKPKPEDNPLFKPRTCKSCHAQATIERKDKEYAFSMVVDRGKDDDGKPKIYTLELRAPAADKKLVFENEKYTLVVSDGKITGGRSGRVAANVELKQQADKK